MMHNDNVSSFWIDVKFVLVRQRCINPNSYLTTVVFSLSTRHIFFMHVKEDLHNGHLRMASEQAEELSALLAQAEFGDYNQNTAKYWYSELCGEEPSPATINRYSIIRILNISLTFPNCPNRI